MTELNNIANETNTTLESKLKVLITSLNKKDIDLTMKIYDDIQLYIERRLTTAYIAGMTERSLK